MRVARRYLVLLACLVGFASWDKNMLTYNTENEFYRSFGYLSRMASFLLLLLRVDKEYSGSHRLHRICWLRQDRQA